MFGRHCKYDDCQKVRAKDALRSFSVGGRFTDDPTTLEIFVRDCFIATQLAFGSPDVVANLQ